jgi:hypothetical protein
MRSIKRLAVVPVFLAVVAWGNESAKADLSFLDEVELAIAQ